MVISALHLGHGPFFPANLSFTWNRVRHPGQVTWIAMNKSKESENAMSEEEQDGSVPRTIHPLQPSPPPRSTTTSSLIASGETPSPLAHVVLLQPEIPQNTGNIGRTCVAVDAHLWIVRPIGFQIDDRAVRRAGLDYWDHLRLDVVDSWEELTTRLPETNLRNFWFFTRAAERTLWQAPLAPGDCFVFGSESCGFPPSIHALAGDRRLRLPTSPHVRSLNLANTVAVVLYDLVRRFSPAAAEDPKNFTTPQNRENC